MSAAQIIEQIEALPKPERLEVEEWLKRQSALEAFDEMCRISDQHSTLKHLTENQITALCEREGAV